MPAVKKKIYPQYQSSFRCSHGSNIFTGCYPCIQCRIDKYIIINEACSGICGGGSWHWTGTDPTPTEKVGPFCLGCGAFEENLRWYLDARIK